MTENPISEQLLEEIRGLQAECVDYRERIAALEADCEDKASIARIAIANFEAEEKRFAALEAQVKTLNEALSDSNDNARLASRGLEKTNG